MVQDHHEKALQTTINHFLTLFLRIWIFTNGTID